MGIDIGSVNVFAPLQWIGERIDGNGSDRDGGFGRPFDSYLPQPIQMAESTIAGAVRRALDKVIPEESDTPDGAKLTKPLDRANEAGRALVDELAMFGNQDRFHSDEGWKVWRTEAWPLGQVLHGRIFQAMQGGDWDRVDAIFKDFEAYREGDGFTGAVSLEKERFYDDNDWIGLAAMQAYSATKDDRYLEFAKRTFEFVKTAEHPDGGSYWLEQDRSGRHTCSTAPAGQFAMRLFEATGDRAYMDFATGQAEWLNANLRDDDGLYIDNVKDTGEKQDWKFSYNQGSPIGLDVQLYHATKDEKYLTRAKETAAASIEHFGQEDRLWKQAPVFNAIFARNLLALQAVAPDPKQLEFIDAYLERLWTDARNSDTGLFTEGDIGAYEEGHPGSVIDQGAIAQMFAVRALPPDKWSTIT